MTRRPQHFSEELRLWRAVLICVAILAQLLLPAVVLRAQALAGELCVAQTGSDGSDQKAHAHDQQCAHCRLHNCSPLTPPSVREVRPTEIGSAAALVSPLFPPRPSLRAKPPPTGPPAA
jgi:hypothetical protein